MKHSIFRADVIRRQFSDQNRAKRQVDNSGDINNIDFLRVRASHLRVRASHRFFTGAG